MTKPYSATYVPPSLVDRALEHAQMAFDLGLIRQPRLYEDHSLACNLCGYRFIGATSTGTGIDPWDGAGGVPLEVPNHWLRDHTPIELIMRAAYKKGNTDG